MTDDSRSFRYQTWLDRENGRHALECGRDLLRGLVSVWPRRSRSMLVLNAGSADFLEVLWEAGFEVTGQDSDVECLERARQQLGRRAEFVLSHPEHLPFDDCWFDYAVAVAVLDFWRRPEPVLREMGRLACGGVILIFPNAWSLFGLECRLRRSDALCASARPHLQSPYALFRLIRNVYSGSGAKIAWSSVLPGPSRTWKKNGLLRLLNSPKFPLPLGAFAGLRIDFGPTYAGTPMVLRGSEPITSAK